MERSKSREQEENKKFALQGGHESSTKPMDVKTFEDLLKGYDFEDVRAGGQGKGL